MVPKRLKELRQKFGYTLEYVGLEIGLEESTAKSRISRYEQGVHVPDFNTIKRISHLFNVPVPYFYAEDDELAEYILQFEKRNN